ncbi:sulfurtransferase TusA family protein [Marinobacterium weihaiense]|uniref:Sulfurtransferase TusA family protein n=1 Tax=Marinobacterium weihaiense TaxID=2851016 RepID=A0ABS6M7E1_9GAMM|nr:sulfurtransferase TusA family protein [Marinobacterium weihaiense]MBV0932197.1 sulfurtransferase TusA family protein [Marinobacterium weihaiense]
MNAPEYDEVLDASGLNCPMPLLKAKLALHQLEPGQVLKVIATDAGSVRDFPAYTNVSDHELLHTFHDDERFIYWIRRGRNA